MEDKVVSENSVKFNFAEGEMLLIDKPLTWTSFDVVGKIRNSIKPLKLKVGHAGTLDPLATGLLIVCTGKLTKQIDSYQAQDKEYTGTITLGGTTPSYDLETEIDHIYPIDHITEQMVFDAAKSFEGEIQQFPPAHSALKINGERVYEKARRGEEVEIKSRQVRINSFVVERIELPNVYFRISCSKGTYIRSLAYDFGKVLQSGSHLSALRRTKSGDYNVDNAWNLEQLIVEIKRHKEIIK